MPETLAASWISEATGRTSEQVQAMQGINQTDGTPAGPTAEHPRSSRHSHQDPRRETPVGRPMNGEGGGQR